MPQLYGILTYKNIFILYKWSSVEVPDTFVTDKATDQVSIPCLTHLNGNHYNTEDVILGYTCYKTHHEDVAISKEGRLIPPETCIHYLSKYHTAAATIESIPYSHELSEIGIRYLQTQQPPQHLLLSKHKLANFHIRKCF